MIPPSAGPELPAEIALGTGTAGLSPAAVAEPQPGALEPGDAAGRARLLLDDGPRMPTRSRESARRSAAVVGAKPHLPADFWTELDEGTG